MRRLAAVLAVLLCVPAHAHAVRGGDDPLVREFRADGTPSAPGFAIDFVAVTWSGEDGPASIRFRHGERWSAWQDVADDAYGGPVSFASPLVPARGADAFEARVPSHARDARAVAIRVPPPTPASHSTACDGIKTRVEWHADESLRRGTPVYWPLQKLIVHHTGEPDVVTLAPEQWVQAIYRYQTQTLGFDDIGYHILIGPNGCVFEGRASSGDGYIAQDANGRVVQGAHVFGFNRGTLGVALLGNFERDTVTPAASLALESVLAEFSAAHDLDPQGSGAYVDPATGATRAASNISGHRDWAATECPGRDLYARLPAVRQGASAALAGTDPGVGFTGVGPIAVAVSGLQDVAGWASDDRAGVHHVRVTFTPEIGGSPSAGDAALTCDAPRLACDWTRDPLQVSAVYRAEAEAVDRVGNRAVAQAIVVVA